eukprot:9982536-Alexandrium_andersonii.AAC.1
MQCRAMQCISMQWNATHCSAMDWNGVEWKHNGMEGRMEWTQTMRKGAQCNAMRCAAMYCD